MKFEFSQHNLEKYSNTKFHGGTSSGNRVVASNGVTGRQTDRETDRQIERQTDMTKLTSAFHNSMNAPNKRQTSVTPESEPRSQ
jgi:isopentenyl phosphate kinase